MQLMRRRQETWDPFRELEELSNRWSQMFGITRPDGGREDMATMDWAPSCDISETAEAYRVKAELPNVTKDNVHVTLDEGVLTIRGERREEKETKDVKYHRRELAYGNFVRRFTMPADADESKVDATFKDGMLDVVIAKSKAKVTSKSREITVH